MLLIDHSSPTPAENLALDEALLEACEAGELSGEILRFWASPEYFVVLGYTGKLQREVNIEACRDDGIPILRRCTGGGTVLQGPGCLNYSLILRIDGGSMAGISQTNSRVTEKNALALQKILGAKVDRRGDTDLAVAEVKVSGNAQKRKQKYLLFHGTFLLDFDLPLIAKYLQQPPTQPEYRAGRDHLDFVMNLRVSEELVKSALREAWDASEILQDAPFERMAQLVTAKYLRDEWNLKF